MLADASGNALVDESGEPLASWRGDGVVAVPLPPVSDSPRYRLVRGKLTNISVQSKLQNELD
jgi:hypothetical protein